VRAPCPTPDRLLIATSGEYPVEWRRIEDHVRQCAMCQARIRADAATVHAWSMHHAPDPPPRLRARARAFQQAISRRRTSPVIVAAARNAISALPWALAVAGTLLLTTVLTRPAGRSAFESTLDRAMLCEIGRSLHAHQLVRLQVHRLDGRTTSAAATSPEDAISAIRASTDGLVGEGWPELTGSRAPLADIPRVFEAQGVDTHRPLSAAGYQEWRRTAPNRRDELLRADHHVMLRTTTMAGALREATLVLDRVTACVVAQSWTVHGIGRVEFEAIAH
jgi:hypothetical protein